MGERGNLKLFFLFITGKCTIGACNAIIPTYTAFQYPCVMRNLAVGVGNFAAGAALMIVPYLWLLVGFFLIYKLINFKLFDILPSGTH